MSSIQSEFPDSDASDRSVFADVVVRQEPDEEKEEEDDDSKEDDDGYSE
jgi:hypothetical protein